MLIEIVLSLESENGYMRIAVVDLVSVDGGGFRITSDLYNYIAAGEANNHKWLFIVSEQNFSSNEFVNVLQLHKGSQGYLNRAITEIVDVNRILKDYEINLVIAMSNIKVLGCSVSQMVYMQQSIPFQKEKKFSFIKPEERKYAFRQYVQGSIIKQSIRRSKGVFVQTHWVEKAVKEVTKEVPVLCIGYPSEVNYKEIKYRTKELNTDFFYPCGPEIYKNLTVVVDAINELKKEGFVFKVYLTLTENELESLTNMKVDPETIICLGKIPSDRVLEMYTHTSLIFASYIETVGMPLVEAKNAGTWIIASDCDFSHEVLDDYPNRVFFDYRNEKELAKQMRKVLSHSVELQSVEEETKKNSECWRKMIQHIERLEENVK